MPEERNAKQRKRGRVSGEIEAIQMADKMYMVYRFQSLCNLVVRHRLLSLDLEFLWIERERERAMVLP